MQRQTDFFRSLDFKKFQRLDWGTIFSQFFLRDPLRAIKFDPFLFYSPADGIINYCAFVKPNEKILFEGHYIITPEELVKLPIFKSSHYYVTSIFMTAASVHINRMPTTGIIILMRELEPLDIDNYSMIPFEQAYFERELPAPLAAQYQNLNERVVIEIYYPRFQYYYIIVQIADRDVNLINNYCDEGDCLIQGERLGEIRWGSDVILLLPYDERFEIECLVKPGDYVYAGQTPIYKLIPKNFNDSDLLKF